MSVKIMSAVFESEDLAPTERLIMLALADHADDAGRCYPSIGRLCRRTGLGERTVQTNMKALVARGYVTIIPNAGQGLSNLYFIRATPAAAAPPQDRHPRASGTSTPASPAETPAAAAPKPSVTIIKPSEDPPLVPPADKPEDEGDLDPPKAKTPKRRAVRIPEDWVPSDRNISDAQDRNFSAEEIDHEAHKFRDYHLAHGTAFVDWDAGWRTWLGNSRKFSGQRVAGGPAPRGHGQGSSFASIVARRRLAGEV